MRNRKRLITRAVFVSTTCLGGALAMGQAVPTDPGQSNGTHKGAANADPQLPKAMNNNGAAQIGMMMGHHGGSLLKASLAAGTDPGQAKLNQISYYAVAEPAPKTLKKHDLVTIVIREESSASTKAQSDSQKNTQLQAQINNMIQLHLLKGEIKGLPTPSVTPGIDFTGSGTFHGQGEIDRSDTITGRITAEVLDVKPNGTLVLQARKHIKTDEEEQQFLLTGICRAEDIGADNTILSTQMYDLLLQKNSKGDVRMATERGRLPKLLDFINPF